MSKFKSREEVKNEEFYKKKEEVLEEIKKALVDVEARQSDFYDQSLEDKLITLNEKLSLLLLNQTYIIMNQELSNKKEIIRMIF